MRSYYKRIGDYVTQIKLKNTDDSISSLKGININKHFMPSVANINGTDLSKYRVVKKNQFAFNPMHVGRDEVLPISMLEDDEPIIVSPAYVVFEVKDEEELLPAYLMMWCRRSEFDRNAWFMTDNSVRGGFSWADFCDMKLPVPSIEKQREIVREYNVVNDRIALNEQLTQKLEDTAQALYKQWFVDFEFPISKEYAQSIGKPELEGKPYKSSGGEMRYCEEVGELKPSIWKSESVINAFELQRGFDLPRQSRKLGSVPIVSANGGTELHDTAKVTAPGVVTGRSGTLGNVFFIEEDFWPLNTTLWVKNFKAFTPIYTYFFLSNLNLSEYSSGSAVPTLNRNDVHDDFCIIPASATIELFDKYIKVLLESIKEKKEEKKVLNQMLTLLNTKMSKV
ncbi:TPA: restriction endonuclease subunit S [Photobacterium damselae]